MQDEVWAAVEYDLLPDVVDSSKSFRHLCHFPQLATLYSAKASKLTTRTPKTLLIRVDLPTPQFPHNNPNGIESLIRLDVVIDPKALVEDVVL